jgi:hypothetical protein
MAGSIAVFYSAKLYATSSEVGMADISIADIIQLAGALAIARCDGPHVMFTPGRKDASVPDPEGLLPMPPPEDDYHHLLMCVWRVRASCVWGCLGVAAGLRAAVVHGACWPVTACSEPRATAPAPPPPTFHRYFLSNGLSEVDAVVLLGSHTTACFQEGCLDSTPNT